MYFLAGTHHAQTRKDGVSILFSSSVINIMPKFADGKDPCPLFLTPFNSVSLKHTKNPLLLNLRRIFQIKREFLQVQLVRNEMFVFPGTTGVYFGLYFQCCYVYNYKMSDKDRIYRRLSFCANFFDLKHANCSFWGY
jgi:hypothetical protein